MLSVSFKFSILSAPQISNLIVYVEYSSKEYETATANIEWKPHHSDDYIVALNETNQ